MRELHRSKYIIVLEDEGSLLRRVRTPEPYASLEDIEPTYEALFAVLDALDRRRYVQLVDARLGPARNDPGFEAILSRYHPRLYAGFHATAVLVQTAAGRLQLLRMMAALPMAVPVYQDEAEAVAYLREQQGRRSTVPRP